MPSGLSSSPRTARRAGGLSLTGTTVARTAFCALTLKRKPKHGFAGAMAKLPMRRVRGDFIVTGPDIEPMMFKSRPEARDWCRTHHLGSPITEIGPGGKRAPKKRERPSR
jgi:hypothetical protein